MTNVERPSLTKMSYIPEELQEIVQDYVGPAWTRSDWKTCKHFEAEQIGLVHHYFGAGNEPRNVAIEQGSDAFENWTFYDLITWGRTSNLCPSKGLRSKKSWSRDDGPMQPHILEGVRFMYTLLSEDRKEEIKKLLNTP